MAAPKGSSDNGNTAVIVMIIFIVLFLISAGLAIAFYVNIEKSNQKADDALARLDRFGSQITELERLAESSGLETGTTSDKLASVINSFSDNIIGKNAGGFSLAGAKAKVDSSLAGIWENVAIYLGKDPETELEQVKDAGLVGAVVSLVAMIENMNSELVVYQQELDSKLTEAMQTNQKNEDLLAQLQEKFDAIGATVATMKDSTNENIQDLTSRYQGQIETLKKENNNIVTQAEEFRNQLNEELKQAELLRQKASQLEVFLSETRPQPTIEVNALDPDGKIISVDASEKMVYIDLAASDKIYRGLTFSVYDGYENTIPVSGKGKATIEVVEIMDTISRCRVVENENSSPIIANDIIANIVWDKDRQFVFCVIGEFDFDMDGEVDMDGYDRIEKLITNWGGKVQNYVDIDTDFVVYGEKTTDENNTTPAVSVDEKADNYDKALDEAVRLAVPRFDMSRFFRFIGYGKKQVIN